MRSSASQGSASFGALSLRVPNGAYSVCKVHLYTKRVFSCVFPLGLNPREAREVAEEMRELLKLVDKWGAADG